jgi:oligoendopeptidase F
MRVTQNERLKTFIRELSIDLQKIYNTSNKEEIIEYTRQKYIEYVKKKKNSEDSTFKTINEVWSAIRRDPEMLFSFVRGLLNFFQLSFLLRRVMAF